jgi:uncharacterized OsmC-like protein
MIPRASKHSVVATHAGGEAFDVAVREHVVRTDQPRAAGGDNSGPTPLELTSASLAACVALYVHRFCSRNGIDARGMAVEVNPIWRADPGRIARFDVLLHLPTSIPEHLAEALLEVARECPVHHTLVDDPEIVVRPVVARRTPVRRLATV